MTSDKDSKTDLFDISPTLKKGLATSKYLENIIHALRTPLNSIIGFSRLINERAASSQIPSEIHQYLKHIEESGTQLLNLSSKILELSLLETDQEAILHYEQISLERLIHSICQIYQIRASLKSIWFTCEIDDQLPKLINTDKGLVTQILSNLLDNAIKFTDKGKSVTVAATVEQNRVIISVQDEGVGIDNLMQAEIHTLFNSPESQNIKEPAGAGLGLIIVKKMITLLKGEITFQSIPTKGSVFSIQLPISDSIDPLPSPIGPPEPSRAFSDEKRLLIIEDDPVNLELYQSWLEGTNLEVFYAMDGDEAINLANNTLPDLIVSDIHLPGLDGLTAIRMMKRNPKLRNTPTIVITAGDHFDLRERAVEAGCNEYLAKPIESEVFLQVLHGYLDNDSASPEKTPATSESTRLSPSIQKLLSELLKRLQETPIHRLEKLIDLLAEIRTLFSDEQQPVPTLLNHLEKAAFQGDASALEQGILTYFNSDLMIHDPLPNLLTTKGDR